MSDDLRLVIFDVDGTLVDSQVEILAAMQIAFDGQGIPCPSRQMVLSIVGLSLPELMLVLAPDHDLATRNALIEGEMTEGQRVLLVEDLTTDGGSKLSFVDAIRETGASCAHTAVIFHYGIFPQTEKTLGDHGVSLHALCTWWDVLAEARAQNAFDAATLTEVEAFLNAPREWQESRNS